MNVALAADVVSMRFVGALLSVYCSLLHDQVNPPFLIQCRCAN